MLIRLLCYVTLEAFSTLLSTVWDILIGTSSTGNLFSRTLSYRTVSTYASPCARLNTKCVTWTWIGSRISHLVVCLPHWRDVRKFEYTPSRRRHYCIKFSLSTTRSLNLYLPNDIYIYIYIYMSYRTANLQKLHFVYLFNKYTYWIF